MKLSFILLVCFLASMFVPKGYSVELDKQKGSQYYYEIITWKEMTDDERKSTLRHMSTMIAKEIKDKFGKNEVTREISLDAIKFLNTHDKELENTYDQLNEWALNETSNWSWSDVLPTGIMFVVGVHAGVTKVLGLGGSISVAFVFIPRIVTRVNKFTGERFGPYNNFDLVVLGIPVANVALGVQAGIGTRLGLGFMWGDIPATKKDFWGVVMAYSGDLSAGIGFHIKGGTILKTDFTLNPFIMFSYAVGAEVGGAVRFNVGGVISGDLLLKTLGNQLKPTPPRPPNRNPGQPSTNPGYNPGTSGPKPEDYNRYGYYTNQGRQQAPANQQNNDDNSNDTNDQQYPYRPM